MSIDEPSVAPLERAALIGPSRRNRIVFIVVWLIMTTGAVWMSSHLPPASRDARIVAGVVWSFWLLMTANVANKITIAIKLKGDMITVSCLLRGRRQLLISEIQEARYFSIRGRTALKLIPVDPKRKPISFAIDVLTANDQKTVRAFVSGRKEEA